MRRYFWLWTTSTLILIALVAAINFAVDPYRVFGWIDKIDFNHVKPNAGAHAKVAKAFSVVRAAPRGLILGNSRAEVGFDPQYERWPHEATPIFNLALPGTGTGTALEYLHHALATARITGAAKPALVVMGLDFIDFLPEPLILKEPVQVLPAPPWRSMGTQTSKDLRTLKDVTQSLLSISALLDSVGTVAAQRDPQARDLTAQGFNPMRDYDRIASLEGYRTLFRQKNANYVSSLALRARNTKGMKAASVAAFNDLENIVRLCRSEDIELKVILYPYHAQFLEAIRLTGLWADFENWKIELVDRLSLLSSTSGPEVPVWDFSHFNNWTTEAVPPAGDKRGIPQWYWESGHFKKEMGNLVLDRVLAVGAPEDDFGLRLTRANVMAVIQRDRLRGESYLKEAPAEWAELQALLPR